MWSQYTFTPCYMHGCAGVYGNGYDAQRLANGYDAQRLGNVYGYGPGVGYIYEPGKSITSYQQNKDPKNRSAVAIPLTSEKQKKENDDKIAELKQQLKTEGEAKLKQEAQLKALLTYNKELLTDKKELVAENSKLTEAIAEMKINQSVDLEDITKLKQKVAKVKFICICCSCFRIFKIKTLSS